MRHWATVQGPYVNLTHGYAGSIQSGEDPDMFKTKRGWHMLNHNTGPGSSVLGFSVDGLTWHIPKSAPNAFTLTVPFDNSTVVQFCQRQRPQVVFGKDGMPGWFWSGVMEPASSGKCPDDRNATSSPPTWTLVQAIGRPPPAPATPQAATVSRKDPSPVAGKPATITTNVLARTQIVRAAP